MKTGILSPIKYLEENGFYLLREGGNHSIYTNIIDEEDQLKVKQKNINQFPLDYILK